MRTLTVILVAGALAWSTGCEPRGGASRGVSRAVAPSASTKKATAESPPSKDENGYTAYSKRETSDLPAPIASALTSYPKTETRVELSDTEWRSKLSGEEFEILRSKGTERAGTGDLLQNKDEGIYTCAGCNAPLFSSSDKFKSGTGWPSFTQPIEDKRVAELADTSHGMRRVEVLCARCDGHLGHVFRDGPKPTGLRYCINAASMNFDKVDDDEAVTPTADATAK